MTDKSPRISGFAGSFAQRLREDRSLAEDPSPARIRRYAAIRILRCRGSLSAAEDLSSRHGVTVRDRSSSADLPKSTASPCETDPRRPTPPLTAVRTMILSDEGSSSGRERWSRGPASPCETDPQGPRPRLLPEDRPRRDKWSYPRIVRLPPVRRDLPPNRWRTSWVRPSHPGYGVRGYEGGVLFGGGTFFAYT